jgi:hypothetical protein
VIEDDDAQALCDGRCFVVEDDDLQAFCER